MADTFVARARKQTNKTNACKQTNKKKTKTNKTKMRSEKQKIGNAQNQNHFKPAVPGNFIKENCLSLSLPAETHTHINTCINEKQHGCF